MKALLFGLASAIALVSAGCSSGSSQGDLDRQMKAAGHDKPMGFPSSGAPKGKAPDAPATAGAKGQ